ncbi:MAG TPA: hypothetical protein VHJ69_10770 [Gemmatimonadales bacterium]|jgi:hypothetical protein|nr:hypothetical protein [Gemmatimonadales bacterium]
MRSRAAVAGTGLLAGAVAGWLLAQRRFAQNRRDLFSASPIKRLGALGYLAGQTGVDRVRVLHDYLAWETHPLLRRRAQAIVRRLETQV